MSVRGSEPHPKSEVTLEDRYLRDKGLVYLTGVHALVRLILRLPLDQHYTTEFIPVKV